MTNSKHTKRALCASVLSVMLCAAMLVGSTFAWFTDSVTSGKNKIVAGNLDVELYHSNGNVTTETKVDADTKLFVNKDGESIKWEPGVMVYENFTVKNVGSLALKYKLTMNADTFNTVTVDGAVKSLKDVLKVAVLDEAFTGDRAAAQKLTFDKTLDDFTKEGNLAAGADDDTYAIVIYWEPSAADNDYNLSNGKESSDGEPLFVELGVNLVATQDTVESDSFGKDYDADAKFDANTDWFDPEDPSKNEYTLATAEELAGLAELVNGGNNFQGKTIKLTKDVDMQNAPWTPIGTGTVPFSGTFDGNGKTISNIHPETTTDGYTGLFGKIQGAVISDLTIKNGTVTSSGDNTGALAGAAKEGKIRNITVDGVTVTGKDFTGGLLGNAFTAEITDCTVKNSTISGGQYLGGIAGQSYSKMKNVLVENCQILGSSWKVGGIIGQFNEGNFTFDGLTVRDSVIQAASGSTISGSCVGGLFGFMNYGQKTLNNCSVIDCTVQLDPNKKGTLYGASGMIGQILAQSGTEVSFNSCVVSGLNVTAEGQAVTGVGGYIGNGYWQGFKDSVFEFNGCTVNIVGVTAATKTDIGAFVGNGKDNTYTFSGLNEMSGVVSEVFGARGGNITVKGEDTINQYIDNETEDPWG